MAPGNPLLKLAHDDGLAIYTRSDTTLILAAKTFTLTQQKVEGFNQQRLLIYAHTVLLASHLKCPGKEIQIHCNYLKWAPGTSLDVSGKPGETVASVGANDAANGQDGGSLCLHVHNLNLSNDADNPKAFSYWKDTLTIKVDGGSPGKYHQDAKTTDWEPGNPGRAGSVKVYYSNRDLRYFAMLYNAYYIPSGHVDKLRALGQALPKLRDSSEAFQSCRDRVERLAGLLQGLLDFHVNLTKCMTLLQQLRWSGDDAKAVAALQLSIRKIPGLQDYSLVPSAARQEAKALVECLLVLQEQSGSEPGAAPAALQDARKRCVDLAESVTSVISSQSLEGKRTLDTPLSELVTGLYQAGMDIDQPMRYEISKNTTPQGAAAMYHVTMDLAGQDDLEVPYPLVHPDQCQMELRQADADFFAENIQEATEAYMNLRERLAFVPSLRIAHEKSLGQPLSEKAPLLRTFYSLEAVYQLSQWTISSLSNLYAEVCARLDQLSLGNDLFGLSPDWVPRLSTQYYMGNAIQQIERLKRFEDSYWKYFDSYQEQMEAGAVLKAASTANMYRQKESRDTIESLISLMREKEASIVNAKGPLEEKRKKLADDLQKVQTSLKKVRAPSASSIMAAVGAVIITGAAFWVNPPGVAAGLILGGAALAPQAFSLWDEAENTIEDAYGQKVNKRFLISRLSKCESDLKSLLDHPSYSMAVDGTTSDGADTAKIMATTEQVESYLKQFRDVASSEDAKLGKSLDESLKAFVAASNARNQDMLAYNNAVIQSYQMIRQSKILDAQAGDISSQLIKENIGLPSIVAFYQRYRDAGRLAALRTIKHVALALRFCGLVHPFRFTKGLLSDTDELEAHVDILSREYDAALSYLGSFPQCAWPASDRHRGILYRLSKTELAALKLEIADSYPGGMPQKPLKLHTVQVESLATPATLSTSLGESPFSGLANVRLSQVRFWAPGLKLTDDSVRSSIMVEIKQEGVEKFTSPKNELFMYRHLPVYLSFQYDWEAVRTVADISNDHVMASQSLASDWSSSNANARVQAPIGPFSTWVVTIRERDNGGLDWSAVKEAYLEFHGSAFPFQR